MMFLRYLPLVVCAGAMTGCTTFLLDEQITLEQYRANLINSFNKNHYGSYQTIAEQIEKSKEHALLPEDLTNAKKGSREDLIADNITRLYNENNNKMDEIYEYNKNKPEIMCDDPKLQEYKNNAIKKSQDSLSDSIEYDSKKGEFKMEGFETNIHIKIELDNIENYKNKTNYLIGSNAKLVKGTCVNNVLDLNNPIDFLHKSKNDHLVGYFFYSQMRYFRP